MCNMFSKSHENKFDARKSIELIETAINGNTANIEPLVKSGANINYVDEYGDTALSQAAFQGHSETVKKLLSYLTARYSKNRALLLASQAGHGDVIDILVEAKAEVNVYMEGYHTPLFQAIGQNKMEAFMRLLTAPGINLNQEDKEGVIPVLLAAYNGRLNMLELLILHGADVTVKNVKGKTALDMATMNKQQETVDYLNTILTHSERLNI